MSLGAGAAVRAGERGYRLGKLLKSGGAGSVYPLSESADFVAKIYHDSSDVAEYERKVGAMLELSPNLPDLHDGGRRFVQIAWPQALLRDGNGRFVGFLMPVIDVQATSELECILQERQARAEGLPTGLGAKITLAANLAAVIAELHRQGHHVVDLKPVNVRFYRHALYMAMLDCDGFAIQGRGERFAAQQITPDYLAPEFHDQAIPAILEEQQDRFALAVVVFQLLNFGIHPFTGRPTGDAVPTDIPGRIARRCYAYGLRANASLQPSPVSGHASMPSELRALFDRAFENAGAARPSAAEWASTLRVYAQRSSQRLVACMANREHQHFAGHPCAACARSALISNTARQAIAARSNAARMPSAALGKSPALPGGAHLPAVRPVTRAAPASQLPPNAAALVAALMLAQRKAAPPPKAKPGLLVVIPILVVYLAIFASSQIGLNRAGSGMPPPMPTPTPRYDVPQPVEPPPPPPVPAAVDTNPESVRQAVEVVVQAMPSGDPMAIRQAITKLRRSATPRVGGPGAPVRGVSLDAYEQGRRHLWLRSSAQAVDSFLSAIASDPDNAQAWYGYAVAQKDDNAAAGAFAVAESLTPDRAAAELMRADFPPDLLRQAGIDARRYALREARGREIAAKLPREALAAAGDSLDAPASLDLDFTEQRARSAAVAMVGGNQPQWLKAVADIHDIAATHPGAPSNPNIKRVFDQLVETVAAGRIDDARRSWLSIQLTAALQANPRDIDAAYALGWLKLLAGEKTAARRLFVQAIWCNPDRARAWYGLGVTLDDDREAEGTMAMAEYLYRDPQVAASMRNAFSLQLLTRNGIASGRFEILQARARRLAESHRGGRVDATVEAIANRDLPPR